MAKYPLRIAVLLFDRFSNHCLANAVEPLRAVNALTGRHVYDWRFMTLDGGPVTSSSGLPVQAECALSDSGPGDMLLVISSYGFRTLARPHTARALRAAERRFRVMVGLDTGSWLLASAGLLDGREATIHWEELDHFHEQFPDVSVRRKRFVRDGDVWTCGGAMTAFDLMGRMIGESHGEALRMEVAALFMAETAAVGRGMPRRPHSRQAEAACALMREHLEEPLTIPALAAELGLGQRRLEQLFRTELGQGPHQMYRHIRLRAARRLVEQTGLSVAEIALRCGYRNPASMTRAFREEFGMPPRSLRARLQVPD